MIRSSAEANTATSCPILGRSMAWISTFSLFRGRLQSLEESVGISTFQHDGASSRALREHLKLWGQINKFSRQYFKSYALKCDYGRRYLSIHCGVYIPRECLKILLTQLWHRATVPPQRKTTVCGLLTSWGTADCGVGVGGGGFTGPQNYASHKGYKVLHNVFDHRSKCLDSHSSHSKVYLCNMMDLAHRETILSPLLIGVAQFQTRCHPLSHRWHELEFLCYLVDSAALGPTQPPVQ